MFQFEERDYDEMKWICTPSNNPHEMFIRLYDYIEGNNSENENMDMTIPVNIKWVDNEVNEECFYLSRKYQNNPPEPLAPDVYIETRPAMTVFTRFVYF